MYVSSKRGRLVGREQIGDTYSEHQKRLESLVSRCLARLFRLLNIATCSRLYVFG